MARITLLISVSLLMAVAAAAGLEAYTVRYLPAAELTQFVSAERMHGRPAAELCVRHAPRLSLGNTRTPAAQSNLRTSRSPVA